MLVYLTIEILARGEMTTRNIKKYKKQKSLKISAVPEFSGVSYERVYVTLILTSDQTLHSVASLRLSSIIPHRATFDQF